MEDHTTYHREMLVRTSNSTPKWPLTFVSRTVYKAGVIAPAHCIGATGYPFAGREATSDPSKPLDLYFDWRGIIADQGIPPNTQDPYSIAPLQEHAATFASRNPAARFAVIRIWSAPHFYPLMIGFDNRDGASFIDGDGRAFEWKFVPKDMPRSEISIHRVAQMRIEPYRHFFGEGVVVRRDCYLVMGTGEAELRRLAAGVVWALQTRPWLREVDVWRSFFNVDGDFVKGLGENGWLD